MRGLVVKLDRGYPLVKDAQGREIRCEHATTLLKGSRVRATTGDAVEFSVPEGHDKGIIDRVLARRNAFVRKDPAERSLPQVLAANFARSASAQAIEDRFVCGLRLERS